MKPLAIILPALAALATTALAADDHKKIGYDDSPMQPNGKWHIHDGSRPMPKVVTPGAPSAPSSAPSDAIVLLGSGNDISKWAMDKDGSAPTWKMQNGV